MKRDPTETSEDRILRMVDVSEIQQLQHRYQQWLSLLNYEKIIELFAKDDKKPTAFGKDPKGFFQYYTTLKNIPGFLVEHYAICPVIEVAKDRKTAKGTWLSPGIILMGPVEEQNWAWGKYTNDYIREDGEWKIWHLLWVNTFMSDMKEGPLAEQESDIFEKSEAKGLYKGQADPNERIRKIYRPDEINYLIPEPPEPYNTWEA